MVATEIFTQFDAEIQALIAEVETIQPPAAVMGRRSFLKLAGFAGGGLLLAFHLDTRSARAEDAGEHETSRSTPSYALHQTIPSLFIRRGRR